MNRTRMITFGILLALGLTVIFTVGACSPRVSLSAETEFTPTLERQAPAANVDLPPTYYPSPLPSASPAPLLPTSTSTPTPTPTPTVPITSTPSPSATPTSVPCLTQGGRLEKGQLASKLLRDPLDYQIYLPPCYADEPGHYYPVLYLIHGQSSTDDQWVRLGAPDVANQLIASGEIIPFIIVMPRDRVWSQPTEDRFGDAVVQELIPWVDQHYRTLPNRVFRAVGGLSRGAGWAVHLGLAHYASFGAISASSLPIFWADVPYIKIWLSDIPPEMMPRISIDIGDNDRPEIMESAVWFEKLLTARGIPHEWHLFIGYHDEAYWSKHLEGYLRWVAVGWK